MLNFGRRSPKVRDPTAHPDRHRGQQLQQGVGPTRGWWGATTAWGWKWCARVALALTIAQIGWAVGASDAPSFAAAYHSLNQWDSGWYAGIAQHGYHSTIPPGTPGRVDSSVSNVAFFPAYPILVRFARVVFGLPPLLALAGTAQLFALLFWFYLLLIMDRLALPRVVRCAGLVLVLSFPTSFFLVVGYSESLFLASGLGFIYWTLRRESALGFLAPLHGLVMMATKISGVAFLAFPLLHAWSAAADSPKGERAGGRYRLAVFDAVEAAAGALLFFLFTWVQFGAWDLYFWTQTLGWNIRADYLFLLNVKLEDWRLLAQVYPALGSDSISRVLGGLMFALLLGGVLAESVTRPARDRHARHRLAWYATAFLLWYISLAGVATKGMKSMSRYALASFIIFLVPALSWYASRHRPLLARVLVAIVVVAAALASGWLQNVLLTRFVHGHWVA